jgi:hypothetical protein
MKLLTFAGLFIGWLVGSGQSYAALSATQTFDLAASVTSASGEITHYEHFPVDWVGGGQVWIFDALGSLISIGNPNPSTGSYATFSAPSGAPVTTELYANGSALPLERTSVDVSGGGSSTIYYLDPGSRIDFKVTYSFESTLSPPFTGMHYHSYFSIAGNFFKGSPYGDYFSYTSSDHPFVSGTKVFDWSFENMTAEVVPVWGQFNIQNLSQVTTVPEPAQSIMMLLGLSALGLRLLGRRRPGTSLPA